MEKSRIIWADDIRRQRSDSNPISISPKPTCIIPAPLKPAMSKTERKTRERWRNTEVDTWLKAYRKCISCGELFNQEDNIIEEGNARIK